MDTAAFGIARGIRIPSYARILGKTRLAQAWVQPVACAQQRDSVARHNPVAVTQRVRRSGSCRRDAFSLSETLSILKGKFDKVSDEDSPFRILRCERVGLSCRA